MDLSTLTTPKINELRENLNLTDDECVIFDMLAKNKSIIEISAKIGLSVATVNRRIRKIKNKIELFGGLSDGKNN